MNITRRNLWKPFAALLGGAVVAPVVAKAAVETEALSVTTTPKFATNTITVSSVPSHTHSLTGLSAGAHTHTISCPHCHGTHALHNVCCPIAKLATGGIHQ